MSMPGKNTTVSYDGTAIGSLRNVTPPRKSIEMVDDTDIDADHAQQAASITVWGPATITYAHNKADAGQIKLLAAGETAETVVITQNDGSTYTGDCIVNVTEPQSLDRRNRGLVNATFEPVDGWVYDDGVA
jgi:hypothetical protein